MEVVCFDTYAWVEYFQGTTLGKRIAEKWVDGTTTIVTPAVVLTEIESKALKAKQNPEPVARFIMDRSVIASIDARTARRAAKEKNDNGLHTVDALVYASARENGAMLATGDEHLIGLEGVVNIKKL